MSAKKRSAALGVGAMFVGILAIPTTAFVSTLLGLAMLTAPVFMCYRAS